MISAKNIKKGNTVFHDGKIHIVLENSLSKKARGSSVTKLKMKSIEDGAIRTITFLGDATIEQVILNKIKHTCLYKDNTNVYFMNNENYEQIIIPKKSLNDELNYLADNAEYELLMHNEKFVAINLPEKVKLKVIESAPAVRGDTVNNPQKDIIVETGYQLKAPLFIKQNEYILVNTSSGKYDGKA